MPWSPLGQGFLTGKVDPIATFDKSDVRSWFPRFTLEAMRANQALVDLLTRTAERKQATPAQIALAWLLAQKPWIVPIPGTRKLHRLEESMRSAEVTLASNDLAEINAAVSQIQVHGGRGTGHESYV